MLSRSFVLALGVAAALGLAVIPPSDSVASEVEGTPAPSPAPVDPEAAEAERERRVQDRTERAKREAEFNQLDQDGDGYLSEAELGAKEDLRPPTELLDQDGDGRISRTEFAAVETSSLPDDPDSSSP